MTDCPLGEIRDLLPDLVHDRLDPAEYRRVNAHVRECAQCTAELQLLRTAVVALRRAPVIDADRIARAVRRAPIARTRRRARPSWLVPAAAALVLFLAGLLTLIYVPDRPEPADRGPVAVTSPGMPTTTGELASLTPVLFGGGLADLDEDELETMLYFLDTMEALPAAEPLPLLHGGVGEGDV